MNKIARLLILITLLQLPLITYAQQVREDNLKKGKEHMAGYTVKYKHSKKITKEVMQEMLQQNGMRKASHKKGYYVYKGANLPAISPNKQDYYYKITGNKRKATVHFAASKGYDNYVTNATDAAAAGNINNFLTELDSKVTIKEQINKKQSELKEMEKNATKVEKEKAKKQQEIDKLQTKTK